jgi:hypothetical protein
MKYATFGTSPVSLESAPDLVNERCHAVFIIGNQALRLGVRGFDNFDVERAEAEPKNARDGGRHDVVGEETVGGEARVNG